MVGTASLEARPHAAQDLLSCWCVGQGERTEWTLPVAREPETLPWAQRPRSWAGHRRDLPGGARPGPRGQWLVEDGATFRSFQGGRLRGRGLHVEADP